MAVTLDITPERTLAVDRITFPHRIYFIDLPIHRVEEGQDITISYSRQGWMVSLEIRGMIHPRQLWRVLERSSLDQERVLLNKLDPILKQHDQRDPLARRYGRPTTI